MQKANSMKTQAAEYFILGYPKMFASYEDTVKYRQEANLDGSIYQVFSPEMTKQLLLSQRKSSPSLDVTNVELFENAENGSTDYVTAQVSSRPYYYRLSYQHEIPSRVEQNHVLVQFHSWPVAIIQRLIRKKVN